MRTPTCLAMLSATVLLPVLSACLSAPVADGIQDQATCAGDFDCPAGFACVADVCAPESSLESDPITDAVECKACGHDSDCGDGLKAGCWLANAAGAAAFCGRDCTGGGGCPAGTVCRTDTQDSYATCVPTNGWCMEGASADTCASMHDTWTNYTASLFSSQCTRCHSWAGRFTDVAAKQQAVQREIANGSMPPGGLYASDEARVLAWLACGAPQ